MSKGMFMLTKSAAAAAVALTVYIDTPLTNTFKVTVPAAVAKSDAL